jgi:hypothetical protein
MNIKDLINDSAIERLRQQSEQFERLTRQFTVSDELRRQFESINAVADRFREAQEAALGPASKIMQDLAEAQERHAALFKPALDNLVIPPDVFEPPPLPNIEPPPAPMPESQKVIAWINAELEGRTAKLDDPSRQQVVAVVTLPSRKLVVLHMSSDGDSMVFIEGVDGDGQRHEVTAGAMSFEIDFKVLESQPPKPDLKLVE